jgi:uracil-DNA glycosylase family 4
MPAIAIVGEAWGEHEERERTHFVGPSGYELTRMLAEAGIRRADCLLTNVFHLRPPGNKIEALCGPKPEGIRGYPPLLKSKFVRREFIPEIERLGDEIVEANPNIVICLGNTALWAMCGVTAISKLRGTTRLSTHTAAGFKTIATYHPAAVLRQWELRPVTVVDLAKAARESEFPEIRRPKREIWIEPTLEDIHEFVEQYIYPAQFMALDIETAGNQVTCIGMAPSPNLGIVVPFVDPRKKGRSYWPTAKMERAAWEACRRPIEDRRIRKALQNGMYDIAFLWRAQGIRVINASEDSMLLHHALQPESLKGLGFLGSVYTDEGSWKQMREKHTTIKRDD